MSVLCRLNTILLPIFTLCLLLVYLPLEANSQKRDKITVPNAKNESRAQRLTLRRIMSEKGEREGILTSGQVYISDDGVRVSRVGEVYSSFALATTSMNNQLKEAVKIIWRGDILENRRRVGERVVAEFSRSRQEPSSFVILKTHNRVLVRIESSSLKHTLAFEAFEQER